MAELLLVQERKISGKGVLKLPDDAKKPRYLILYADVVRPPKSAYLNYNYNPPRSRYATLTFLRNDYVIHEEAMEWEKQSWDGINDICGQTMIAVKCAYAGTLESFNRLSAALGLVVLPYTDLIKNYENLALSWDEIRIKCYADTAINLRLYKKAYDTCDPAKDLSDRPPKPPAPPPKVPAGTPIDDVSPPYDKNNKDDGNTDPYRGDRTPADLPTENCKPYNVVVRVYGNFGGADGEDPEKGKYKDFPVIAVSPIQDPITTRTGTPRVQLPCRGIDTVNCGTFQNYGIFTGQPESDAYGDAEIVDFSPYP